MWQQGLSLLADTQTVLLSLLCGFHPGPFTREYCPCHKTCVGIYIYSFLYEHEHLQEAALSDYWNRHETARKSRSSGVFSTSICSLTAFINTINLYRQCVLSRFKPSSRLYLQMNKKVFIFKILLDEKCWELSSFIYIFSWEYVMTVGCATSHKNTNVHNSYDVKYCESSTKQYYRSSLHIQNSSTG
jgi:hypothetical protein